MWDILALGSSAVDDILFVPHFPTPDTKMEILRRERRCGGLTAVAMATAARLGVSPAFAGVLGYNEFSRFVETSLQAEGIDTSLVPHRDDASPVYSAIIADVAQGTRTILYSVIGQVGADPLLPDEAEIYRAKALFIDDFGTEGNLRAVQIARAAGVPVIADFERPNSDVLVPLVDHLIVGDSYAMRVTGAANPAEAARVLLTDERAVVIVTCGADGGWYLGMGMDQPRHYKAFTVEAVDTTGCGDVFHGAYAAALVQGMPLDDRVRLAAGAAALKARTPGGISSIPNRAQVDEFLRTR